MGGCATVRQRRIHAIEHFQFLLLSGIRQVRRHADGEKLPAAGWKGVSASCPSGSACGNHSSQPAPFRPRAGDRARICLGPKLGRLRASSMPVGWFGLPRLPSLWVPRIQVSISVPGHSSGHSEPSERSPARYNLRIFAQYHAAPTGVFMWSRGGCACGLSQDGAGPCRESDR
jgi:hypothetical protein